MPSFRYRALTQAGEVVGGSIAAPTAAEVIRQVEYLGLVPIDAVNERAGATTSRFTLDFLTKPSAEDITIFTRDLALLLKSGARIDTALDLLATEMDIGRLRPIVGKVRADIIGGESFAEALSHHPAVFPDVYVALARVGEASGTLDHILEVLAGERQRVETVRRKLAEATRYPAFVLLAACSVLTFFLLFVLPNFASVLRDFNAKLDPIVAFFLGLSDLVRQQGDLIAAGSAIALMLGWLLSRRRGGQARRAAHSDELADREAACDVSCHRLFLPQSRRAPLQRHDAIGGVTDSGRNDGRLRQAGSLGASGGPGSPWRQTFRRIGRSRSTSDNCGTHAEVG